MPRTEHRILCRPAHILVTKPSELSQRRCELEQQIFRLVTRYAASQMSRLPRCGSTGKSADLLCADAGFFLHSRLNAEQTLPFALANTSECTLVAYQLTVSKCLLPLYKLSSKLSLWPVSLLSAFVLPACDHHHSTQRNPWDSENINHTCIGFRNINRSCVALTDLLISCIHKHRHIGCIFFSIFISDRSLQFCIHTLISGRLRY